MSIRVRSETGVELQQAVAALLPLETDLPYANFAPLAKRPGAAIALHAARWEDGRNEVGAFVARDADDRPLAAARLLHRPFESEHFDMAMALIDWPIGVADCERRSAAYQELIGAAFEHARGLGYAHIAVRASSHDIAASRAAQAHGALHVGTQLSWMLALDGHPHEEPLPPGFALEEHAAETLVASEPSTWKRIAEWGASSFDRSPFAFDPTLPMRRSLDVYQAWTEKVMQGEWADRVVLVRHAGEVVAFISLQELRDVSEIAGVRVLGRCLAATLLDHHGLATAIVREIAAKRPLDGAYLEGETPVTTLGTINLFAKTGFRYLRATAHFHRRLDGAPAA